MKLFSKNNTMRAVVVLSLLMTTWLTYVNHQQHQDLEFAATELKEVEIAAIEIAGGVRIILSHNAALRMANNGFWEENNYLWEENESLTAQLRECTGRGSNLPELEQGAWQ